MKTLLLLAALSTASSTFAAEFPITGIYGNDRGCTLYAAGGEHAVYSDGSSIEFPSQAEMDAFENGLADESQIVVTREVIVGHELGCVPIHDGLGIVSCVPDDMNGPMTLTLTLDTSTDILFLGSKEPEALHRCPTSETPTM